MEITVNVNINAAPELLKALKTLDSLLSANLANTQICAAVAQLPPEEVNPVVSIAQPPAVSVNTETTIETTTASPEPAVKQEPAPVEVKPVKLEDVRAKLHSLMEAGKGEAVKALFSEFGVTKLTALPADKLPELLQKAGAL